MNFLKLHPAAKRFCFLFPINFSQTELLSFYITDTLYRRTWTIQNRPRCEITREMNLVLFKFDKIYSPRLNNWPLIETFRV